MKSEKYLNRIFKPMSPIQNKVKAYDRDMVNKAIKIAEQETEERMRKKAIKTFECILYMPAKQLAEECRVSIDRVCEDAGIDYCRQLFIKKLNEK